MSCIICNDVKSHENICHFTEKTWSTCTSAATQWLITSGKESEIAAGIVNVNRHDIQPDTGYHRSCYCKFTNKIIITRKIRLSQTRSSKSQAKTVLGKRTRTRTSSSITLTNRSTNVLPPECLICHKDKNIKDRLSGKRNKERLSTCEYISGKYAIIVL